MKLYRQRLLDPWLAHSDFTDYLIDQFDRIQQNCSVTLPYTTSDSTLYVGLATPTVTDLTSTVPTPTATSTETPACQGQLVERQPNWLTCNDLSDT